MPAIGSDDQIGMNGELAARGFDAHTLHHAVLLEQVHTFSLHAQLKLRVNSPAFREEVEEVPLRHERDELCVRGQVDRKSTRLNSSHMSISYAVFCLKKKKRKRCCEFMYGNVW